MHENKETIKKQIGDYCFNMEALVGEGFSSKVYKGFHIETKQVVAIKVVSKENCSSPIQKSLLQNEIKILLQIDHRNLLRVYEISQSANNTYIVSEYCDGGNLQEQLNKEPLKIDQALQIFMQICKGLQVLHQKRTIYHQLDIIHRDIKPANILIKQGIYKLADFGFAVKENDYESIIKRYNVGTPMYMAPEIQLFNQYSEKSDIWALGIILYEMLFHKSPNYKISQKSLLKDITQQSQLVDSTHQPLILSLFKGLLQLEPDERINIQQVLNLISKQDHANRKNSPLIKLSQKSISTQIYSPLQSKTQTHHEMRKKYFQQLSSHSKPFSYDNNKMANLLRTKTNFNEVKTNIFTVTSDDESKRVDTTNLNSFRNNLEDDSEVQIELIGQINNGCESQKSPKKLSNLEDDNILPLILKPTYKFCQFVEELLNKNCSQESENFVKFNFLLRKLLAIKAKVFYTFAPICLKDKLDQWINQLKDNYQLLQHQINLNLDRTFQLFFNPSLDDQGKLLSMYIISIANQIPIRQKEIQIIVEIMQENLKHQNDPFLFARKQIFQKLQ